MPRLKHSELQSLSEALLERYAPRPGSDFPERSAMIFVVILMLMLTRWFAEILGPRRKARRLAASIERLQNLFEPKPQPVNVIKVHFK